MEGGEIDSERGREEAVTCDLWMAGSGEVGADWERAE